jgi:hypothetical protein
MSNPFSETLKRLLRRMDRSLFEENNIRRITSLHTFRELADRHPGLMNAMRSTHPELIRGLDKRARLQMAERRIYSQGGEDGLLLHFFSTAGAPNKTFIEFGIEDGVECNAANLAVNFGWHGLFLEGSPHLVERARAFYHQRHGLPATAVRIENRFVTRDNVNTLFREAGFDGEVDLLSIDIDGADYWIWEAVTTVRPRVVAIEYNASFGAERSVTVPYEAEFDRYRKHTSGWYHGASLGALAKLAAARGYALAGCDSFGANAFFVRRDVMCPGVEEFTVAEAFYPSVPRLRECSQEAQFNLIRHLPLTEI